jgi:hypothetical protein
MKRLSLALGLSALGLLSSVGAGVAQAQAEVSAEPTAGGSPISVAVPVPASAPSGWAGLDDPQSPGSAATHPPSISSPETPAAPPATGPFSVIRDSIFGAASEDDWRPLSLGTFFTEGWDRPFVRSPDGTNGAPKQNWFGSADGIFVRLSVLDFFYTNSMTTGTGLLLSPFPWAPVKPNTNGNQYWASYNLYLPLNQRLEILVVVPFVASNTTSPTGHYVANFGDLTISERFRLVEQRNFSLQALLTERTPTGQTVNGNDINYITPSLEFWWNFAPRWVMRGGTGVNIDTGRTSATDTYFTNAAIGRYLTTGEARFFRNLVAHVSVSTMSDVLGRKGYITDAYVAPGLRFGFGPGHKWAMLAAIQIPVTGPHPYAYQANLGLARNY